LSAIALSRWKATNNPEEINKLFRSHSHGQGLRGAVGLKRLGAIAPPRRDLIGRLRDGEIEPSPAVVDLCLSPLDVLKKTLHRQWADETEMRTGVDSLLGRIAEFAPLEPEELEGFSGAGAAADPQHAKETEVAPRIAGSVKKAAKQVTSAATTVKSVRIALARLSTA